MSTSKLFTPLHVGQLILSHRLTMAPMTRLRASNTHAPLLPLVKDYYRQRASVPGSLLITEATVISPRHSGYTNVPGIYSEEQISAWKEVTNAVHEKGSHIYMQLWALGRTANPGFMKEKGLDLVSSGDVPMKSMFSGEMHHPRPLEEQEILAAVGDYAAAAENAVKAGFDGVEIHGANGYLVDQFIQDTANNRTDNWGSTIPNRSRFALDVTRAVTKAVGNDKTAIRLSPWSRFQGMRMEDPIPQFSHLIENLSDLKLAYLHLCESEAKTAGESLRPLIDSYNKAGPVMVAANYTGETAVKAVEEEYKDNDVMVAFGRPYIANPDLSFRVREGLPLAEVRQEGVYAQGEEGYTDYGFSEGFKAAYE